MSARYLVVYVRVGSLHHRRGNCPRRADHTRPVDRPPYRANPRASAVVDKCVNGMFEWGIIEEWPSQWGSQPIVVAKRKDSPLNARAVRVSVLITVAPLTVILSARIGPCQILNTIWTQWMKLYTYPSLTSSTRSGRFGGREICAPDSIRHTK